MSKEPDRNYGIDALRILAMYMIVVLHINGGGGVISGSDKLSLNYWAVYFLEILSYGAVDCYALISGYVGYDSEYKPYSIIRLWVRVVFYTFIITLLFSVFIPKEISVSIWIRAVFPITFQQYWYFSAYVILFLFMPILNAGIRFVSKRYLFISICSLLGLISILQILIQGNSLFINHGYTACWLMILYICGAYIKKYSFLSNIKKYVFLLGYFFMIFITWLSKMCIELVLDRFLSLSGKWGDYLVDYTSPTILLGAVFLCLFFVQEQFNPKSEKAIKKIAPLTFSVYLIHNHPLVMQYCIKDRFVVYATYPVVIEVTAILGTALLILVICICIDYLRDILFKWSRIDSKIIDFYNKMDVKVDTIINKK